MTRTDERPFRVVSPLLWVVLTIGALAQVGWQHLQDSTQPQVPTLSAPPERDTYRLLAFGEPATLARLTLLWLQGFDSQAGADIPYQRLNYPRLIDWLKLTNKLEPQSEYPLFAATYLYAAVNDPQKVRQILEFVHEAFRSDPLRHWRSLAHAVVIAKHRLADSALARQFAQDLRTLTRPGDVPTWARQMEIFILSDMGELESARMLIGAMIDSGEITDPHELRLFDKRLRDMNARRSRSNGSQ